MGGGGRGGRRRRDEGPPPPSLHFRVKRVAGGTRDERRGTMDIGGERTREKG